MAIPRFAARKILPLSAVGLILLGACSTKPKHPKIMQADPTSVRLKPQEGEAAAAMDEASMLAAFAQYSEAGSDQGIQLGPTPAPDALPTKIRGGAPVLIGKILLVNEGSHFVLIDTKAGLKPPPGATVATQGLSGVSSMRVSKEQRREFLSADIVDGVPAVGDSVIWQR